MIVATPVTEDEQSAGSWGRAHRVAVADVREGAVSAWAVHEVRWDESHDAGSHGSHHAAVVRFLKSERVEAVVVDHVGEGMARMLASMGVAVLPASPGDAKASVVSATAPHGA